MKKLLSGNEALARGAWEAGIRVAAGYPGTPSTEILETLAPMPGIYAEWCPNEKVAVDVAVGAAYAGVRSLAVMKHVGLNVAADALFYASMTGMEAGMILMVADDPGMHSSQGEQDTRRYAKFARVPCLEPSDSQEAKEMVRAALEISERFDTPVLIRTTTRISHSYGLVELGPPPEPTAEGERDYRIDSAKYVMVPANARKRHVVIEERSRRIAAWASSFPYNRVEMADSHLGIITHGVVYQYVKEIFPKASVLRLGMTWPIPTELVTSFAQQVERLIVVEELDPVIEEELRLLGIACEGKSIFPLVGELTPERIRKSAIAAGLLPTEARPKRFSLSLPELPPRPPILCPGCPHRGIFTVLRKLKVVVNGDIGCYTLGFLPPLKAVHTTGCMGASIGQAHGVAKAGIRQKHVAIIGDSTFLHSGIPALLNVAYNQSDTVTIILDNRTTAMTGHQDHPGTGQTLQKVKTRAVDLPQLIQAMGIEDVAVVDPYNLAEVEAALRLSLERESPSVIISRRECVLLSPTREGSSPYQVDPAKCTGCRLCLQLGCPAIFEGETTWADTGRPQMSIDPLLCTGCSICAQVCPVGAIHPREEASR
ncbi:MAG: indolepyruvate ferredoxin oxidoreductase subunit alpha [Anaerolineae bacterium]|nr:indolepyruvate ferredoxin oxidoreductase subunit alpha [Anaerolineae bacterium]